MMERTQIYLTREERQALRKIAERRKQTQSEVIRDAIDRYIKDQAEDVDAVDILDRTFGIWADYDGIPDIDVLRRESDERIEAWQ